MAITKEELELALDELFDRINNDEEVKKLPPGVGHTSKNGKHYIGRREKSPFLPDRGEYLPRLGRQYVQSRLAGAAEMFEFIVWLEYTSREENSAKFTMKPHFSKVKCEAKMIGSGSYDKSIADTTYNSLKDLEFIIVSTLVKIGILTKNALSIVDPENNFRGRLVGNELGITESRKINVESKEEIGEKDVEVSPELIQKAKSMLEHAKPKFSMYENFITNLSEDSANSSDNQSNQVVSVKKDHISNDQSFEYQSYRAEIQRMPKWQDAWSCAVYKNGEYQMGIKGPQPLEKAIETAKRYIDARVEKES